MWPGFPAPKPPPIIVRWRPYKVRLIKGDNALRGVRGRYLIHSIQWSRPADVGVGKDRATQPPSGRRRCTWSLSFTDLRYAKGLRY